MSTKQVGFGGFSLYKEDIGIKQPGGSSYRDETLVLTRFRRGATPRPRSPSELHAESRHIIPRTATSLRPNTPPHETSSFKPWTTAGRPSFAPGGSTSTTRPVPWYPHPPMGPGHPPYVSGSQPFKSNASTQTAVLMSALLSLVLVQKVIQ